MYIIYNIPAAECPFVLVFRVTPDREILLNGVRLFEMKSSKKTDVTTV
jgi:hypothetical protein